MDAISCLAPPPAALLMGSTSSFADAAIARALHYSSMASPLSAAHQYNNHSPLLPQHVTATTCDSVLVAHSPPAAAGRRHQHKQQLAPAGGRAGKQRRSRASKRAPTTYISTDPANFRIMVQHITGLVQQADDDDHPIMMMAAAGAYGKNPLLPLPAGGNEAPASALEHQQQPCFPTLDSWNVMYEGRTELL